ncbi:MULTISPECIES: DUF6586 family protein [unclassified Psychrobacter]|uniref:DUF6586 family protein n=1 Tax=unclassified Psychrobacter TaxID=196806 RepID=UPI0018F72407|nr:MULTISPECIES: DUF6586 family protein [unclassified Psychrobacter]
MAKTNPAAQYHRERTNQKLYFCRLACQAADGTADKQLYQAHCENAIFHLYGTFLAFLQELGQYYDVSLGTPSIEAIESALAARTQISPEINRLQQLKEAGFLADIVHAYERCLQSGYDGAQQVTPKTQDKDIVINVVTLSNSWLPDDNSIREWRQQLLELIDNLREGMQSY